MIHTQIPANPFATAVSQPPPPQRSNVAIFWAYEGMEVLPSIGTRTTIEKLVSLGSPYGQVRSLSVYASPYSVPPSIVSEFKNLGAKCPESYDDPIMTMITDMLLFAVDNRTDAGIIVVCSSPKLYPVISSLRNRGYEMALVHKNALSGLPLASTSVTWQEIMGEAEVVEPTPEPTPVEQSTPESLWSQIAKRPPASHSMDFAPLVSASFVEQETVKPSAWAVRPVAPIALPLTKAPSPPSEPETSHVVIDKEHLAQFLDVCRDLAGSRPPEMVPIPATTIGGELYKRYPNFPRHMKIRYLTVEAFKYGRCAAVEGSGAAWVVQVYPKAITQFLTSHKLPKWKYM